MKVQIKRTSYYEVDANDLVQSVMDDDTADKREKILTIIYAYPELPELPGPYRQYSDILVFDNEGRLILSGHE